MTSVTQNSRSRQQARLARRSQTSASHLARSSDYMLAAQRRKAVDQVVALASGDEAPPWKCVGPANFSGRIKTLALHPTDPLHLYAGAAEGGVWATDDGGASWRATMERTESLAIGALAISTSHPDVLYAATGEDTLGMGASYPGAGVYRTTDGAVSWHPAPVPSKRCTRVQIHPTDWRTVFVAGDAGLHGSNDGGDTWRCLCPGHLSDLLLDPERPNTLFAALWQSGVYKSTDGGGTWQVLDQGLPTGEGAGWIKLAMGRYGQGKTDFLLAKLGEKGGDLYQSVNGGETWIKLPENDIGSEQSTWTSLIAIDPTNHDVIYAGGDLLGRSVDGGNQFVPQCCTHVDHHAMVFGVETPAGADNKTTTVAYVATDGGVFRLAEHSSNWVRASDGLVTTQFYGIGISQTEPFLLAGATQDVGILQMDNRGVWRANTEGAEGNIALIHPHDSRILYAAPTMPDVCLLGSTDAGKTWRKLQKGIEIGSARRIADLAINPFKPERLLCVCEDCVYVSEYHGIDWTLALTLPEKGTRITYSAAVQDVCFVFTERGHIFRSDRHGEPDSWNGPYPLDNPPPFERSVTAVAVSAADPSVLFIGLSEYDQPHVLRSIDGGETWESADGESGDTRFPDIPVNALLMTPYKESALYAATDTGVLATDNEGRDWYRFDRGLPSVVTSDLVLHVENRMLFAATMGRGIFCRNLPP